MTKSILSERPKTGHKGTFGTVAVFAGHISDKSVMLGSAVFVAKSALKSGVGIADFFGDKQTLVELIKILPQAVGHTYESFGDCSPKWSSIVVGPGWENTEENIEMLKSILKLDKPAIIDGEALNIMAAKPKILEMLHNQCVLTPHVKEFDRLANGSGVADPQVFAKKFGCVLVLKSSTTKVLAKDQSWELKGNNPVLATGGTGDVLAGLIAGYAAQYHPQVSLFDCACEAIRVHAQAAEKYRKTRGDKGLIIDELIELLD